MLNFNMLDTIQDIDFIDRFHALRALFDKLNQPAVLVHG
jgi:hypothetical protein